MKNTEIITKDHRDQLLISGVSLLVGLATKTIVEKGWEMLFEEDSPSKGDMEDIDFKKVLLWTAVSGTVISSAKLVATHFIGKKL